MFANKSVNRGNKNSILNVRKFGLLIYIHGLSEDMPSYPKRMSHGVSVECENVTVPIHLGTAFSIPTKAPENGIDNVVFLIRNVRRQ
jgi:hypothetical protein